MFGGMPAFSANVWIREIIPRQKAAKAKACRKLFIQSQNSSKFKTVFLYK